MVTGMSAWVRDWDVADMAPPMGISPDWGLGRPHPSLVVRGRPRGGARLNNPWTSGEYAVTLL
jgi:hypothetical protein